jgi:hypothetical protein
MLVLCAIHLLLLSASSFVFVFFLEERVPLLSFAVHGLVETTAQPMTSNLARSEAFPAQLPRLCI